MTGRTEEPKDALAGLAWTLCAIVGFSVRGRLVVWSKVFFERASAIRDLVYALPEGATFDAQTLDARFKPKTKTRTAEIESILDTFAALGQLMPIDGPEGRKFARPLRPTG
jgi:hypothetical protein